MELARQPTHNSHLAVEDWGLVGYEDSVQRQMQLVEEVATSKKSNRIILCQHPPIVTKGRATQDQDILTWTGPVYESSRGGRVTYHGPNQIVIYPIVKLVRRDLHQYLRGLELAVIRGLSDLGLKDAFAKDTGIWTGDKKIASIGIAVRKWVTYHGIAINIFEDKQAFQGIHPCGLSPNKMTSLESQLNRKIPVEIAKQLFVNELSVSIGKLI